MHLVTHSFCGIDCRAAISLFGAGEFVKSLTTICSPHQGLKLIDTYKANLHKYEIEQVDKAFNVLGVSLKNVEEFTSQNIRDFNSVAIDIPGVEYFSIGAQKTYLEVCDTLKHSHDIISEGMITNRNDGMVRDVDAKWGTYLLTF